MYELIVVAWLFGGPVPDYHFTERWADHSISKYNRYDCQSAGMVARNILRHQFHLKRNDYKIKCIELNGISV